MRMTRIYVDHPLNTTSLTLDEAAGQHLITVLRLKVGAAVQLFNGQGQECLGIIQQATRKQCVVEITQQCAPLPTSPIYTHLGLGIIKGERMDFAIQKSVELGAQEITPLFTQFTDVTLNQERSEKKQLHWQKVAIHACEQSGRSDVPIIHTPRHFADWIANITAPVRLILHPYTTEKTLSITELFTQTAMHYAIAIGPEGGFHEAEIIAALAHDFELIQLGKRILRSETAPLTILSILQWLKGDFNARK